MSNFNTVFDAARILMAISAVNILRPTQRKGRFRRAFRITFEQFCEISSIHGIKYFHDKDTNNIGKFLWTIIVMTMFICAIAMVCSFYQDFASNPIRMNIESDHTPLANLIFPAVTICPPTMYNYPEVRKFFQHLTLPHNVTVDQAVAALDQLYAITSRVREYDIVKLKRLQAIANINNYTTYDFAKLVRWNCSDLIQRCRFQTKIVNCSETFAPSKTHTGWCCSFNIDESVATFRRHSALKFGPEGGLSVILKNTKADQIDLHQFIASDIELYVHNHNEYPHKTFIANSIKTNQEVFAVVRPSEFLSTDSFKALSVEDRQCLLSKEHSLRFFKDYNTDNCEFECRFKASYEACKCFPYMSYTSSAKNTCDFVEFPCLYASFFKNMDEYKNLSININSTCYCPASCEHIEFDVKVTHAQLQTSIDSFDSFYKGIKENYTVLHVFMKSQVYRRYRRDTLSDAIILVGNLGSSFGLFVGMSLISLLEITYFFTLVLWQNYGRQSGTIRLT